MTEAQKQAYQQELRIAAKRLGIPVRGNIEAALVKYVVGKVEKWVSAHGQPPNLTDLLAGVAGSLRLQVVEIRNDDDLRQLLDDIPPKKEPAIARVRDELDDRTDAVVLQRQRRDDWELPYLAVINCRDWHGYRRYFSTWHEVVHLLLEGAQLRFAFRKTSTAHKHPEEVLVDRIAGHLAFYAPVFEPTLQRELAKEGRLTFDLVERVRREIAPTASRDSTLRACLRHSSQSVYFLKANLAYKRAEERQLNDLFADITDPDLMPQPKVRVLEATPNAAVEATGIRIHQRMEVPSSSVIVDALGDGGRSVHQAEEHLDDWQTSKTGPLGTGRIQVEAVRYGKEAWALLTVLPGTVAHRLRLPRTARQAGTAATAATVSAITRGVADRQRPSVVTGRSAQQPCRMPRDRQPQPSPSRSGTERRR